jgi:uncharacterized cupin superfamily protein
MPSKAAVAGCSAMPLASRNSASTSWSWRPEAGHSQRHRHTHEDELIYVIDGELVLITDEGEQTMTAGSVAGFPARTENGHHLVNRSDKPARFLAIGSRSRADSCYYPDIDLVERQDASGYYYTRKDGTRY